MSRIPQHFIDDLINRLDIVEIIDERVKLKRAGKNYSACCPFHEEKTPSFTVSPDKQFYYCFGCGATGTALGFVMDYERIGFVDAVEALARRAGLEVPREEARPGQIQRESRRKQLYEMLGKAADYYSEQLKQNPQRDRAVKYLQKRGLSGGIAKVFGLGFAPAGWDNLLLRLAQNENTQALLIEAGLVIDKPEDKRRYDRFRNRIMFPIRDGRGRYIGFGGRVLGDDKPKYLNSPETPVFEKGRELYGLYEAKEHNRQLDHLIVVEGYMDVIALAQYQIWNAVATLGTACGEEHLKLAFRHVSEVVFCFDGDKAGRTAARRALMNSLSSMEDGRQIRFLFLPEGQDPDTLVRQIGADRFKGLVQRARPLEEFLFEVAADGIDISSMDGRARFSKIAAPLVNQLPDGVFKSLMLDNLAKRTGLGTDTLHELTELPKELEQPPIPSAPKIEREHHGESPEAPEFEAPPIDHYEGIAQQQDLDAMDEPAIKRSLLSLNPAQRALILLLDQPELLAQLEQTPEASPSLLENEDCQVLFAIVDYIQQRPDASFHNIIGYWGGSRGVEAQQALAKLVANEFFGSLKNDNNYNPLKELQDCLETLAREDRKRSHKNELAKLTQKGISALSAEEKQRYLELVQIAST
jgi:DNA primase